MEYLPKLNEFTWSFYVCLMICLFVFAKEEAQAMSVPDDYLSRKKIVLQYDNLKWQISVQLGEEQHRLYFTYTVDDVIIDDSEIETFLFSDNTPAVKLFNGKPLLVWSANDTEAGDSDIYFSLWTGNGWSLPLMIHDDNQYADMSPELAWNGLSLVLTWWRNTGEQIVQMKGTYDNGSWVIETPSDATNSLKKAMTTSSTNYYDSVSRRYREPFVCVALGDSITAGCEVDAEMNNNYWCSHNRTGETEGAYIDYLQPELQEIWAGSVIYNYGHPGERSYQGASRIGAVLDEHKDANCILIMFGANDRYEGLSPTDTKANIKYMADYAIAHDVIPVIASITPNTAVGGIGKYNAQLYELAEEEGITLADQYAVLVDNWSTNNSGDGLHLSLTGDRVVAAEWLEAMKKNERLFPPIPLISPISLIHLYEMLLLEP